ncbi:MAG: hypothetical protein RSB11_06615 [Oscillospiraceae bacterium]
MKEKKEKSKNEKIKKEKVKIEKVKKEKVKKEKVKKEKVKLDAKSIVKYISTGVLAVFAILAVVFAFFLHNQKIDTAPPVSKPKDVVSMISTIKIATNKLSMPYIRTDFEDVFYTANTSGAITFYKFENNTYTKIESKGTIATKVKLSGQEIPATIYYIERDGILSGFGVFTPNTTDADVYIYDFALFKITNIPAAYAESGKCLLLVHTNRASVYYENPVWEECYIMNMANGETTRFLSENNRTVGINGAVRPDFCMITDNEIASKTKNIPFFSSKFYETELEGKKPVDIYIKNDKKETRTVEKVLDKYAKPTDDGGFIYLRAKPDDEKSVEVVKRVNDAETIIHSLGGKYGTSIIRNGDWLMTKEDGKLYSTSSDKVIEPVGYKINPLIFAVSPDEKYVIMMGTVANALDYQIYIFNTETKNYKCYKDENYASHQSIAFPSPTVATYYVITPDGMEQTIIDLSKI